MNTHNAPKSCANFPELLRPYCFRNLKYRYWGRDYHLASSQELFSATQIDRGSQLLLQSLLPPTAAQGAAGPLASLLDKAFDARPFQAQGAERAAPQEAPDQAGRARLEIWDWGCGIGTLGLLVQGHCAQVLARRNKLRARGGLAAQQLNCELRVFDRDALALAFCAANWRANISPELGFSPSLHLTPGIWGEEPLAPDEPATTQLVLSNVPAKLGEPVLRQVLPALAASGATYVAVVIVAPLRHLLEAAAAAGQIEILQLSGSGDHCVIHYRQAKNAQNPAAQTSVRQLPAALKLYKRGESCFALERRGRSFNLRKSARPKDKSRKLEGERQGPARQLGEAPASPCRKISSWLLHWPFRSAYGLPDFERPSYGLEQQVRLLAQRNWGGRILLWQPGHGHLACFLTLKPGCQVRHIDLAGRDRLGLIFAQHNLKNLANFTDRPIPEMAIHSLACCEAMPLGPVPADGSSGPGDRDGDGNGDRHGGRHQNKQGWDLIVLPLEDKLSWPKAEALRSWLERQAPHTWLCIQGRSHSIQQLQQLPGWTPPKATAREELRGHGLRTQLWHN